MDNEKRTKKLLFVATRRFWPTSSGKEVTLFHNCQGLHDKYGYEIYLFCFDNDKTDKNSPVPSFIHDVKSVSSPGIKNSLFRILWKSILTGAWPIQNSLFYSKRIAQELREYYDAVHPDALIIDMVRLSPYIDCFPDITIPHVLIEDDLLAKRYRRQLSAKSKADISGYMNGSFSSGFNRLINSKLFSRLILKGEIRRLERFEASLPDKFDFITFISPIEATEYNQKYKTGKAITLTMGADVEFCAGGEKGEHIPNSVSIVGNFSYGSNAASLEWIHDKVMPNLPDEVKYYVIGKVPDELKEKIKSDRIVFLGFVDDFRPVVKSTDVYLSPILFGTGIKTKVVEAMAMEMPVVTNSVGAEGLDVHNGEELFIAEDPLEMANIVRQLLSDKKLREQVGKKGQEYVLMNHDWNKVYESFGKMGL